MDITPQLGVVVPVIIVVQARFGVVILAWEAQIVGEAPRGCAIAERIMIPPPNHFPAGVGDLMRCAEMIGCNIEVACWLHGGDRQVAEPNRLLDENAGRAVLADEMALKVIDEISVVGGLGQVLF